MIQLFISENDEIDFHEIFQKFKYVKTFELKLKIDYEKKPIIVEIIEINNEQCKRNVIYRLQYKYYFITFYKNLSDKYIEKSMTGILRTIIIKIGNKNSCIYVR